MLTLTLVTKLVCEIALLSLLGRGVLALWVARAQPDNPFYRLFQWATDPFVALAGWISPKVVLPRHHAWVAFCLLAVVWLAATLGKIRLCLASGVNICQ